MAEEEEATPEEEGAAEAPAEDGAAEGAEGEDGEEGGGGFDAKKIILLVVLPLLVLVAIGGGLYVSGFLGGGEPAHEEEHGDGHDDGHGDGHGDEHAEEEEYTGEAAFVEIPTMIVNLNTEDGTPRYLRLSVQLEVKNPKDVPKIEAVIPRVIDQFQTYLRELRVEDLRGSAGIYRLQIELLWRVNQASAPVEVKDVLFQEIVIQ